MSLPYDKLLRILITMIMIKGKLGMRNQRELSNGKIKIKIQNKIMNKNKKKLHRNYCIINRISNKNKLAKNSLNK